MNDNLMCPFCHQDISVNNHAWNCEMNPVNMNNNEFQNKNHKQYEEMFTNFINLEKSIKNHKNIKFTKIDD